MVDKSILDVLTGTHNPLSLMNELRVRNIKTQDPSDQGTIDGLKEVFTYFIKELKETDDEGLEKLGRIMARHFTMKLDENGHPVLPQAKFEQRENLTKQKKPNTPFDFQLKREIYIKDQLKFLAAKDENLQKSQLDQIISDNSYIDGSKQNLGAEIVKKIRQRIEKHSGI
jgi:hypothetical protein